jgi:hypothetical protein
MVAENDFDSGGRSGNLAVRSISELMSVASSDSRLQAFSAKLEVFKNAGHDAVCVPFHLAAIQGPLSDDSVQEFVEAHANNQVTPYLP